MLGFIRRSWHFNPKQGEPCRGMGHASAGGDAWCWPDRPLPAGGEKRGCKELQAHHAVQVALTRVAMLLCQSRALALCLPLTSIANRRTPEMLVTIICALRGTHRDPLPPLAAYCLQKLACGVRPPPKV